MNKQKVLQKIGKQNWRKFQYFMKGQTIGIEPNGEYDYYSYDVEKFQSKLKKKKEILKKRSIKLMR